MDEWSRLPNVLVQQVLSLVSVPELCRFRTVCKRWNSLICTSEFGNVCAQNEDEDHARYIIGHCFHFHQRISSTLITVVGWSIYDLNGRRWFTWKGEQDIAFANDHPMDSDKGLVVCCSTVDCTTLMVSEMIISNPIAKLRKVLPVPPCGDYYTDTFLVKLVVDSISQTYKIFLINRFQDPFMCVFDSTTSQWRSLNNTPVEMKGRGIGPRLGHSVMFQGLLYVLSSTYRHDPTKPRPNEEHPFRCRLHSYNFLKDSWADCGVDFPATWVDDGVRRNELVVSGNRLFVVSGYTLVLEECDGFIKLENPLSVIEILLADKTLNRVSYSTW